MNICVSPNKHFLYTFKDTMKFAPTAVILLLSLISFIGWAQEPYRIQFTTDDYKGFNKNPKTNFKDSVGLINYMQDFRAKALENGYLTSSLDDMQWQEKLCTVNFYLGEKFGQIRINVKTEDLAYFKKEVRLREKLLTNQPFRSKELGIFLNSLHQSLLSNGYPFARVSLQNIQIKDNETTADLEVERFQRLKWSKIHIKGDTAISESYLSNLLQIKKGEWFDENQVQWITPRINQVPFLSEIKPSEILFTPEGVELFVYIKSSPMSSINGFIGLQPDPVQNRYFLTGELALKLLNTLKTGELLDLNWRNIQEQTQQLQVRTNFPFLFKTPFGVDGKFHLYKRDSTFLDLKGKFGIQYFMKGGNFLTFFYERNTSSLLSGSTNNTSFTGLANVKSNNYGIGLNKANVDYLPNPSRGYSIELSSSVGQRQSQKSDTSIVLKSLIFKGDGKINFYFPLAKRHIFVLGNQTSFLSTPDVFQNELYRFGGLTTQRGFNEQEIFASTYTTMSVEYRFLLDRNSRLFLFYDHSFYERNSEGYLNDYPFGFGGGLSFGTKIGIFSIQYALGSQQNNPILFKNGKIHFGYIAYF
jgi:outer membrane protein assembly factor BamA